MIRLNDLKSQHDSIKEELNEAIASVIEKSQFIGGDARKEFEKNFAEYCGAKYCVGTSNGSTALHAVLKQTGIKEGDEVIMPVNTFISTASAVILCGGRPVFVDVNEKDALINLDLVEDKITDKTKMIIPVHLYGNVCEMDRIKKIAERHELLILEDCAQAHGSKYNGKKVPVFGLGCFSFFPAKNLGALGDSGAIVCQDDKLAEKCKMFVNHGRKDKYLHESLGFNYRMNNLQAAVLNVKLKHLDSWIKNKNEIAKNYEDELKSVVDSFGILPEIYHSYYMYVVKSKRRDELQEHLSKNGIETGIHYPVPLHLQPVFSFLGHKKGDFPVAEKQANEILSIPMYPHLKEEEQEKIINEIKSFG